MLPPDQRRHALFSETRMRGAKQPSFCGAGMHRSAAEGRFGEMHRRSLLRREPARSAPEGAARRCAEPEAMTRPQVASRSEVARGLRASVCAKALRQPSELKKKKRPFHFQNAPIMRISQCFQGHGLLGHPETRDIPGLRLLVKSAEIML